MGQEFQAQQFRAVPFVSAIQEKRKEERTTSKTRYTTQTSIFTEHLQQTIRENQHLSIYLKKLQGKKMTYLCADRYIMDTATKEQKLNRILENTQVLMLKYI